jgi:chromosome segregation ATPase
MWMWQSPAEKYLDRIERIEAAVSQKVQKIHLIQQDELIAFRKRLQVLEFENKEMKKKLESQEANVVVIDTDKEKEQLRTELRKVTREKQALEQTIENLQTRIARFFVPRMKALQNQITNMWTELRDARSDNQDLERIIADQKKNRLRMKVMIVPFLVIFILEHLVF